PFPTATSANRRWNARRRISSRKYTARIAPSNANRSSHAHSGMAPGYQNLSASRLDLREARGTVQAFSPSRTPLRPPTMPIDKERQKLLEATVATIDRQ